MTPTNYEFLPVEPHGNAISSRERTVNGCDVRIDEYHSFKHINVAVGEARHYDWDNRTPVGEFGMLSASSTWKHTHDPEDRCGSAIPGNELLGLKWRISGVAAKCRDMLPIDGLRDQYIKTDDIVKYLTDRKYQVTAPASGKDPMTNTQSWADLPKGY